MTEWRVVPSIPEIEVNPDGEIRRVDGLSLAVTCRPTVTVRGKRHYVHKMVAEAFLGTKPEGLMVLHYDDDPHNNKASNLRYDTALNNAKDRRRNKGVYTDRGIEVSQFCRAGLHDWTLPNAIYEYTRSDGRVQRTCRKCKTTATNKSKQKLGAK